MIEELVHKKADMAMTTLKVNSDRQHVMDFSIPFMVGSELSIVFPFKVTL